MDPQYFQYLFPVQSHSGRAMVVTCCDWHDGQTIPVKDRVRMLLIMYLRDVQSHVPDKSHGIQLENTSILLSLMLRLSGRRDDTGLPENRAPPKKSTGYCHHFLNMQWPIQ